MGNFEKNLSRMSFLMEYRMPKNEVKSNIEYHANGADGKVYGILKEGTKYYIKTTESGKENIAESYEYINGFNRKNENEFSSYNKATKQLELKLMSLNEAYGKHEATSTVDFKRSEKMLETLTEDARRELNRMHMIFENSNTIGSKVYKGDEEGGESKGKATDPEKQGAPFGEGSTEGTHENGTSKTLSDPSKANDYTDVKNIDNTLTSDKDPKKCGSEKAENAHVDLEGKSVAAVNESVFEDDLTGFGGDDYEEVDDLGTLEDGNIEDSNLDTMDGEDIDTMVMGDDEGLDNLGGEEEDDLDALLAEMEDCIEGHCDVMTGPTTDKKSNSISMEHGPATDPVNECDDNTVAKEPDTNIMTGPKSGNKKAAIATWDRVNENTLDKLVMKETKNIMKKYGVNESFEEMIQRLVNEEVTRLNDWGKHPRFRKQPMTTPPSKEKFVGTADRDWNDESAKGEQPYGLKIGNGAPFNVNIDAISDAVLANLKEALKKK